MIRTATPVFGQLAALSDPIRSRMLLLLDQQPLSVNEVGTVMQLPQSTVSRHLKVLVDEGWAVARSEGASRVYRLAQLNATSRRIWQTVQPEVARTSAGEQDKQRLRTVLEVRREKSTAYFSAAAGEWERVRQELFGSSAELLPLLALLDKNWTVGDLGCGTGQIARALAPFVKQVIAVDASAPMLKAAQAGQTEGIEYRQGQLESLPIERAQLDVALLFLVLHYVVDPPAALAEAARVLAPGGRLLIVDMMPHEDEALRESMGHVWPGFAQEQIEQWLAATGFVGAQHIPLPVDARAKGPALFVSRASKPLE